MYKLLIIDDEKNLVNVMRINFEKKGYNVRTANNGTDGLELFKKFLPNCVLTDLRMPDINGVDVLKAIKRIDFDIPVIIITAYGSVEKAVNAVKLGAYDFISKPFDFEKLHKMIKEAIDMYLIVRNEKSYLSSAIERAFPGMVGKNKKMKEIFNTIADISDSSANILITGGSGTGKDLIARTIHYVSKRKSAPFIVINCAAVPEDLLEAELFGYEKGAFTGAINLKPGLFDVANGGTIFLDEIADMSPRLQAKLLTAIQNREIRRVGGVITISIDVRFITSTNKSIEKEVQEKRFRDDLYYRLNVIRINLPLLRQRKEDIPLLASFFTKKYSQKNEKKMKGLTENALTKLMSYNYPGNVRELENIIEKAVILEKGEYVTEKSIELDISEYGANHERNPDFISVRSNIPLEKGFEHFTKLYNDIEKEILIRILIKYPNESNQKLAEHLGINRRVLELRLKKHNLNKKEL
jgi:DNA-binding NtrC family response regulator